MAKFVLKDASVVINSVDLSDHVESVTISYESELQDSTSMGDTTRANLGGLLNWSMDINFRQDFAANEVDATIFSLVGVDTTVVVKPTSGSVSTTNPSYSGTGVIGSYSPIGNTVGETAAAPVTIAPGSTSNVLTRATS